MISSLVILEPFVGASGQACVDRLSGYELPSFPVGHVLDTSSSLVVLVGDNGSGKSTLLQKLNAQFNYGRVIPEYFGCEFGGSSKPSVFLLSFGGQLGLHGYTVTNPGALDADPSLPRYSQGQFRIGELEKLLGDARHDVLLVDQPEDGVSLRNRRLVVDKLSGYAFSGSRQVFVSTHEPGFLSVPGSLVVNLDAHPATVTPSEAFDVEAYLNSS